MKYTFKNKLKHENTKKESEKHARRRRRVDVYLLVVMFWPEITGRQDVEGEDVGVYDGLISLWCVSNAT